MPTNFVTLDDLTDLANKVMRSRKKFANRGADQRFIECTEAGYGRNTAFYSRGSEIRQGRWVLLPGEKYEAFLETRPIGDFLGRIHFRKATK